MWARPTVRISDHQAIAWCHTAGQITIRKGYTSAEHGLTCLAARLAFCALLGLFRACCAAPTKLLFPELAAAFPLVTTVFVPACASLLRPEVLQAANILHCSIRQSEHT